MASSIYSRELAAASNQPLVLLELDLDACANTMGTAPCTATVGADGTRCCQSRPTCQDVPNFVKTTRTWRLISAIPGLPRLIVTDYGAQLYPVISHTDGVNTISQDIDVEDGFTRPSEIVVKCLDIGFA